MAGFYKLGNESSDSINAGNFLTSRETINCSRKALPSSLMYHQDLKLQKFSIANALTKID
jgi:hypothetical protein